MTARPASADFGVDIPALAFAARVRRDLLAEAAEIMIAEGAGPLRAVRLDDDELIVERFRLVDIAYRTARLCAAEIRERLPAAPEGAFDTVAAVAAGAAP